MTAAIAKTSARPPVGLAFKARLGTMLIAAAMLTLLTGALYSVHDHIRREYAIALERFRESARTDTARMAGRLENNFDVIFSSLRTISKLPGVRNIDRHATNLGTSDRIAIQELYNNLFDHVNVSEIYIVPAEFNPDAIDSTTQKPEAPAIMFDEHIVGRTSENAALNKSDLDKEGSGVEEVEIHEYYEIKRQIAAFRDQISLFGRGNARPLSLISKEIITCDNSRYSQAHPDDKDRSGVVLSVPYYGPDGNFRGVVSAIILTRVFEDMMQDGYYALYDQTSDYLVASPLVTKKLVSSMPSIRQMSPDPALPYSEVVVVKRHENGGAVFLWSGKPEQDFLADPEVAVIKKQQVIFYALPVAFTVILSVVLFFLNRQRMMALDNLRRQKERMEQDNLENMELIAQISDGIHPPVQSVLSETHVSMQQIEKGQTEGISKRLGKAQLAAYGLLQLADDLQDIAALATGKQRVELTKFAFVAVLKDAIEELGPQVEQKSLKIETHYHTEATDLPIDVDLIGKVLLNLLANAAYYSPAQGVLTITIEEARLKRRKALQCSISNQGPAIASDRLETIFEKMVFPEPDECESRGARLGLCVSKRIIEAHNGKIWAENCEMGGVVFKILLPYQLGRDAAAA